MIFIFRNKLLVILSAIVFTFLNIVENVIQFTIGRKPESKKLIDVVKPTKKDWIKILLVTLIFAILQGVLTTIFYNIFHYKV